MTNILAAIDFSERSPAVYECAATLARALGGHLWLIHVAAPDPDFVGYEVGPQSVRDEVAGEMRAEHRQLQVEAQRLREGGLEVTALCPQGPTVETLVREVAKLGADWLVAGSHGHGFLHGVLMGSCLLYTSPSPRD